MPRVLCRHADSSFGPTPYVDHFALAPRILDYSLALRGAFVACATAIQQFVYRLYGFDTVCLRKERWLALDLFRTGRLMPQAPSEGSPSLKKLKQLHFVSNVLMIYSISIS